MSAGLFDTQEQSAACISDDGRYRYTLLRRWADGPAVTFIMLNPSTADAEQDDPTIRRCVGFARAWGFGALHVVNLYALRATDPRTLRTADDPVGPDNDHWLTHYAVAAWSHGTPLIAAWGTHAQPDRVRHVLALPTMHRITVLGLTNSGQPRHPLYLRADLKPIRWETP